MGLSEFLKKTFVSQTSRVHETGQAIIEYILVLIITVALILGLMYQFNDAFKQFLDSYFGDYIACLLETGELPSLGGEGANQTECVSPFGDFNLSAGTSKYDSSSPSDGSNSQSSGGSDGSSSGDGSSGSGSGGSSGNSRLSPSRVSRSGGTANGEYQGSQNAQGGRPSTQKLDSTSGASSKSSGFNSSGSEGLGGRTGRTVRTRRVVYLGEDYLSDEQKKKKKEKVEASKAKKKESSKQDLRKPAIALEVPKVKSMSTEDQKPGFQFGTAIKILLIIAILIVIFLFFGGQALQIKKSWQKSE